jgi:hypothetical protein
VRAVSPAVWQPEPPAGETRQRDKILILRVVFEAWLFMPSHFEGKH